MSFRCQQCDKAFPQGSKPTRRVVKKREVSYTNEAGEQVGAGWEIAKELDLCKRCAEPPKVKQE